MRLLVAFNANILTKELIFQNPPGNEDPDKFYYSYSSYPESF